MDIDENVTSPELVEAFWAAVDAADAARGLSPAGSIERRIQAAWLDVGGVLV